MMSASALQSGFRIATLLCAFALMLLITIFPRALATEAGGPISHGVLMLIMWGLSAGFVYGVGFVPYNLVLRVALGPWVAWIGFGISVVYYLRYFLP